jgi:hypothetical protein
MKMYHQAMAGDYKEANIPFMVYGLARDVIFYFNGNMRISLIKNQSRVKSFYNTKYKAL